MAAGKTSLAHTAECEARLLRFPPAYLTAIWLAPATAEGEDTLVPVALAPDGVEPQRAYAAAALLAALKPTVDKQLALKVTRKRAQRRSREGSATVASRSLSSRVVQRRWGAPVPSHFPARVDDPVGAPATRVGPTVLLIGSATHGNGGAPQSGPAGRERHASLQAGITSLVDVDKL